ncbi:MFS transporter [Apiospora marii]|uniref:MFS transporter n=1 Tax=Apiospora marii TaxID=335849 RepID=UPI00312EC867
MSVHKSGQESESTTATEGEKSDRIQDYHDGDAAQPVDNALKDAGSEHTPAPATDPTAVYFIVVAQAIFANRMLETIKSNAAHLNPLQVLGTGASEITKVYRGEDLAAVLDAYMVGIRDVFTCVLAGASLAVLLTALVPLRRLPNHDNKKAVAEAAAGEKNEAV